MSEPILATDAERERALTLLREASVDGRLTVEDLAARAELVHAARTRDDLATATAGLEDAPVPAPAGEIDHQRALLASVRREGRWHPAPRSRFSAVFGSISLDLRQAVLPGPEIEIEARSVFGSIRVLVPEGVQVEVSGGALGSSENIRVEGAAPAGAPRIRIRHTGAFGSIEVRSRPSLADQLMERAREITGGW